MICIIFLLYVDVWELNASEMEASLLCKRDPRSSFFPYHNIADPIRMNFYFSRDLVERRIMLENLFAFRFAVHEYLDTKARCASAYTAELCSRQYAGILAWKKYTKSRLYFAEFHERLTHFNMILRIFF